MVLTFLFLALPNQLVKVLLQAEKRPVPVTHLYSLVFLKHFELLDPRLFVKAVQIGSCDGLGRPHRLGSFAGGDTLA